MGDRPKDLQKKVHFAAEVDVQEVAPSPSVKLRAYKPFAARSTRWGTMKPGGFRFGDCQRRFELRKPYASTERRRL